MFCRNGRIQNLKVEIEMKRDAKKTNNEEEEFFSYNYKLPSKRKTRHYSTKGTKKELMEKNNVVF